ncbi:unnamed protein product, partial [Protopolystoma xenopodis]
MVGECVQEALGESASQRGGHFSLSLSSSTWSTSPLGAAITSSCSTTPTLRDSTKLTRHSSSLMPVSPCTNGTSAAATAAAAVAAFSGPYGNSLGDSGCCSSSSSSSSIVRPASESACRVPSLQMTSSYESGLAAGCRAHLAPQSPPATAS